MAKVYTRTGDRGSTSLVDGTRVAKNNPAVEAYGTVDELNSFIGVLIASHPLEDSDRAFLTSIQNRLFDIGSFLAAGSPEMAARLLPDISGHIDALEAQIDLIEATLPHHNKFILPQGTPSCAAANVARTVCRRAERRILDLLPDNSSTQSSFYSSFLSVLGYVNRLSDYLFVLSRRCNLLASHPETYWS